MEGYHTRDTVALTNVQVEIETKCFFTKSSQNSPLSVRSGHRVDVEMELHDCSTPSHQVDFQFLLALAALIPILGGFSTFYSNLMDL